MMRLEEFEVGEKHNGELYICVGAYGHTPLHDLVDERKEAPLIPHPNPNPFLANTSPADPL